MNAILLELHRITSIAITGLVAMAIVWGALVKFAEPELERQALATQESSVKW